MNTNPLATLVQRAVDARVLPPGASAPTGESRPWPVVLLTALGAWLAAVPLLGVIGLLLGDLIRRGTGPYAVGALVLAAAVVVLRSRALPLFVEQLAVPGLLVGAGTLAFGLFRDLSTQSAAMLLALLAFGVAAAVARPWLHVLLGAAAAALLAVALPPQHAASAPSFWLSWHLGLASWLAFTLLQSRVLNAGPQARLAAVIESLFAGGVLATLAALAWWSGSGLLFGASAGDIARELAFGRNSHWQGTTMQTVSALLALGAASWLARAWPSVRRAWCAGVALVVVALAWFMPALGAVLAVLAACAASHRWRLAAAAGVAAAWIVGSFYYQLAWPLATEAVVLVCASALFGAFAWLAPSANVEQAPAVRAPTTPRLAVAGIGLSAVAVLAVANIGIWQKEGLIAHGEPVFVELAPVDPRSLMQGDYMRLNFRVPADVQSHVDRLLSSQRPRLVVRRDARGVAAPLRLDDGSALAADERRIELTPKDGRWILVSDAWFFREGQAERWAKARYGEFRVDADGRALLVGLRGAELRPL